MHFTINKCRSEFVCTNTLRLYILNTTMSESILMFQSYMIDVRRWFIFHLQTSLRSIQNRKKRNFNINKNDDRRHFSYALAGKVKLEGEVMLKKNSIFFKKLYWRVCVDYSYDLSMTSKFICSKFVLSKRRQNWESTDFL